MAHLNQPSDPLRRLFRRHLPEAYRVFLATGASGPESSFVPGTAAGNVAVRALYSPAEVLNAGSTFRGRIPTSLLPIGHDDCGNQICLSLRRSDFGSVHFWEHETRVSGSGAPTFTTTLISPSFTAFLTSLRPISELPVGPHQVLSAWADPALLAAIKRGQPS
jgi:hypothetical protein